MNTNRNHKDRLFIKLFGEEETKGNLLELYNALNDTEYSNVNDLTLTTIDNVIYMGYKNDISFLVSDELVLYEHQSSFDKNIVIRGIIYFAKQLEKYFALKNITFPTSKKILIPEPRFYVLYNGTSEIKDEEIMKLSDSFLKNEYPGEMEWTAHIVNINLGKNKKIFKKCKTLKEYAILINAIRNNIAIGEEKEDAIMHAVDDCIENGILKEYLYAHKAEVIGMLLTEWNEEEYIERIKKEYMGDGEQQGFDKSIRILELYKTGKSLEDIATELQISKDVVQRIIDAR